MAVLLAGLSALFYGAADYTGGRATRQSPVFSVLVLSQFAGLIGIGIAAPLVPGTRILLADMLWGAAAGAAGVLGLSLLYRALATTVAAIASPAAALVGAAVPVIAGIALGERPELTGWIGIALAIPAVLLLTAERGRLEQSRNALLLGILAGLGFGGFFILISRTSPESGLWPLAASKVISIIMAIAISLLGKRPLRIARPSRGPAVVAGVLDMGANVFFLFASRVGLLAISSVVSSLYPAPTVILASILDKQRLSALRTAGLLLALAGVALMTV